VAALVCIVPIGDWGAYSAQHSLRFLGKGKEGVDKGRVEEGGKGNIHLVPSSFTTVIAPMV